MGGRPPGKAHGPHPEVRESLVGTDQCEHPFEAFNAVVPALEVAEACHAVQGTALPCDVLLQPFERACLVDLVRVDDEEVIGHRVWLVVAVLAPYPYRRAARRSEVHRAIPRTCLV